MNPLALLGEFRAETSEHLNALDAHMVELERNPADRQPLRELFRSAHTIKGGAALLGLTDVLELAHALEDVLGSLRDGQAPLERATTELLFRAIDALRDLAPRAQPGSPCRSAAGDEVIAALRQDALRIASPHQAVDSPAEPEPRQVLVVDDSAPIAPLRVLLVDESALHQRVGRHMLQVLGYRVDVVDDGSSALLALADVDYAAVLMDCQLAGMDGLETTQHIRRSAGPTARRTPIIALTADNRAEDRARCLASGMDDILTKPVELADLEACLTRWTRSPTVAVPNILPSPVDTGVLLALRALVQPGQPDPVAPLIELFVQESRGRLADCAAAVRLGNATELAAAAHALKGNSGTFGAGEMHRLATDLEHGARSGSIGSALEILAEMDTEFVRVVQALDAFASQVQYGISHAR